MLISTLNWGILAQSRRFNDEGCLAVTHILSTLIRSSWQTQCGNIGPSRRHTALFISHNTPQYYKALNFYLEEQPLLLTNLLTVLAPRIDHTRVVRMFNASGNDNLPLIKPYLVAVQHVRG